MIRLPSLASATGIAWLPWGREAFGRAASLRRPVLLNVAAAWCRWSAEMAHTTYADARVCDLIARQFVPVWVDAAGRPDVNERYNLGGWPTTAFLTADGQLLGGETFVAPERMQYLLEQVADAAGRGPDSRVAASTAAGGTMGRTMSVAASTDAGGEDYDFVSAVERHLLDQFDGDHGGFGTETKRIHPAAVRFGLRRLASGHQALHQVVSRTLDAIAWRGIYDDVDGGVFRYCGERDWTLPHVEKLTDLNAAVLELLIDGWVVLGDERYRDRAVDLIRYVRRVLVDDDGRGFFASQFADDDYYDLGPDERAVRAAPPVDRSVYTDSTARMASAFMRAAATLDDTSLLACAVTSLEHVVAGTYQRGAGVAHAVDDPEATRGLLPDQVAASEALLDAYLATDREVYLDLAQELMRHTLRTLWRSDQGGFVDRVVRDDDVGLLRHPLSPFEPNCRAAHVLTRLGRLTSQDDLLVRAAETLTSQRPEAPARGVEASAWALAALELRR